MFHQFWVRVDPGVNDPIAMSQSLVEEPTLAHALPGLFLYLVRLVSCLFLCGPFFKCQYNTGTNEVAMPSVVSVDYLGLGL